MSKTVEFNRGSWVIVGAVAGLVAGLLVGPTLAQSPEPGTNSPAEHTITVTGTGTIKVSPDLADVQLGVAVTRDTVKAARDDAAAAMAKVIDALHALGIADADIQTSYLNISPVYDYNVGNRITGYAVNNSVSVHVRDLAKVADVIDDGGAAGTRSGRQGRARPCRYARFSRRRHDHRSRVHLRVADGHAVALRHGRGDGRS